MARQDSIMQRRQYLVGRPLASLDEPIHGMHGYVVVPEADPSLWQHDGLRQPIHINPPEGLMATTGWHFRRQQHGLLRL